LVVLKYTGTTDTAPVSRRLSHYHTLQYTGTAEIELLYSPWNGQDVTYAHKLVRSLSHIQLQRKKF